MTCVTSRLTVSQISVLLSLLRSKQLRVGPAGVSWQTSQSLFERGLIARHEHIYPSLNHTERTIILTEYGDQVARAFAVSHRHSESRAQTIEV